MVKDAVEQFDQVIPGASTRGEQFLGVLQRRCQEEQLGINLQPAQRRPRDGGGIVLRAPIKAGRGGSPLELEVFADPLGSTLHVGWQAAAEVVGSFGSNFGAFRDLQRKRDMGDNRAGKQRALSGILQAFQVTVFLPVLQQLADAVAQEQGARSPNGFLGA